MKLRTNDAENCENFRTASLTSKFIAFYIKKVQKFLFDCKKNQLCLP